MGEKKEVKKMVEKKVPNNVYASEPVLETIYHCIEADAPVLLVGETGTGKTTLIRELAKEKGKELIRVSLNGSTSVEEILGKWLVKEGTTYWQEGVLVTAMKKGHWIVFDEINAALPEILFTLHSLLDDDRKVLLPEKDNEIIHPHAEFRFFATMNPPEEYAGTKDLNKALVSRFSAVLDIEVLDETNEIKVLHKVHNIDESLAVRLVKLGRTLRESKTKNEIFYFCSTRDLVHAGKMASKGLDMNTAVITAIFNKMTKDEQAVVSKVLMEFQRTAKKKVRSYDEMETQIESLSKEALVHATEKKQLAEEINRVQNIAITKDRELVNERMKNTVLQNEITNLKKIVSEKLVDGLLKNMNVDEERVSVTSNEAVAKTS